MTALPAGTTLISQWVCTELASVLARQARMKEMPRKEARKVFDLLDQLVKTGLIRMIPVDGIDFDQAALWVMGAPVPLRGPDALHLAITYRINARLLSLDAKLLVAAQWAGVGVKEIP
ncbi:MAG: type II toxin-antitoxin system VapC family toxin [Magnetococcales bacterium]|nr:type II toxin-antitoxin system VapC family toxin [Magnetococcales bacterium]